MDDVYAGSARAHPVEDRRRIVSRAVVDDEHLGLKVAFLRKDRIDRRQYIIYGTLLKTVTMKETPVIADLYRAGQMVSASHFVRISHWILRHCVSPAANSWR